MLKIKDVMVSSVVTVDIGLTVRKAVRIMNQHDIGCVVVVKKDGFVGILTERDVLERVVDENRNPDETLVKDVMSKPVIAVDPEASLEEATFLMLEQKVKKLPVVADGKLVGLVTITDIARIARVKGLEKLEHADVKVKVFARPRKVRVGEDVTLRIDFINAGKGSAVLMKVENIVPEGFWLVNQIKPYRLEENTLNMKGARLSPFKAKEVKLVLRSPVEGEYDLEPQVTYLDEAGKYVSREAEPVKIKVSKVTLVGRISTGHQDLDNLLLGGIPEKYSVILTSPSCDEKDRLIKCFLDYGIRENQTTFYVTTKVGKLKTLIEEANPNFYLFLCNPKADTMIGDFPNVFKLRGVENLTDISIALAMAFRKLDVPQKAPRRACIEIISDVILQHRALQSRRWLNGVIPELGLQGFTTLATMDPLMHSEREVRAVLDLFEGEISIYEGETEKGLAKFLRIKRLQDKKYLSSDIQMKL